MGSRLSTFSNTAQKHLNRSPSSVFDSAVEGFSTLLLKNCNKKQVSEDSEKPGDSFEIRNVK